MPFALTLGALLIVQTASAVDYWRSRGAAAPDAAQRLRVVSAVVGLGLLALVGIAWDGLGIEGEQCSSLTRPSDLRSGEEYVLGSSLVAAALTLIVALAATRSWRVAASLVGLALAATVVAALYLASHAYWASCLGP